MQYPGFGTGVEALSRAESLGFGAPVKCNSLLISAQASLRSPSPVCRGSEDVAQFRASTNEDVERTSLAYGTVGLKHPFATLSACPVEHLRIYRGDAVTRGGFRAVTAILLTLFIYNFTLFVACSESSFSMIAVGTFKIYHTIPGPCERAAA